MTIQSGVMLYTQGQGSSPENVQIPIVMNRAPLPTDKRYPIGKRWIDSTGQLEYCLTSFSYSGNILVPTWTVLSSSASQILAAGVTPNMVAGSVNVTVSSMTSTSIVMFSAANLSASNGQVSVAPHSGNFTLTSVNTSETSNFYYMVLNP